MICILVADHADVRQNRTQCCKAIILQKKKSKSFQPKSDYHPGGKLRESIQQDSRLKGQKPEECPMQGGKLYLFQNIGMNGINNTLLSLARLAHVQNRDTNQ